MSLTETSTYDPHNLESLHEIPFDPEKWFEQRQAARGKRGEITNKSNFFQNDESFLDNLQSRARRTPDFVELKERNVDQFVVFVYGTLKSGYGNHRLLDNALSLGKASTKEGTYCRRENSAFPVMINSPQNVNTDYQAKVRGEAYIVDLATLARMDQLEANGSMYQRERKQINLLEQRFYSEKDKKTYIHTTHAWVYLGVANFWDNCNMVMPNDKEKETLRYHVWPGDTVSRW